MRIKSLILTLAISICLGASTLALAQSADNSAMTPDDSAMHAQPKVKKHHEHSKGKKTGKKKGKKHVAKSAEKSADGSN